VAVDRHFPLLIFDGNFSITLSEAPQLGCALRWELCGVSAVGGTMGSFTSYCLVVSAADDSLFGQHPPEKLKKEIVMDWNRVEGNWKQVKGNVKEKWGKLTDDDLTAINGKRDQLEGKIQERYGIAKDQARKDIDDWYGSQAW